MTRWDFATPDELQEVADCRGKIRTIGRRCSKRMERAKLANLKAGELSNLEKGK